MKKILLLILLMFIGAAVCAPFMADRESRELDEAARAELPGEFIELPAGITHYQLGGPESGEMVVLVHGFSTPYYGYDPIYNALTEAGFRVLRFDLFGRGYSDRPNVDYTLDLFVSQVNDLVEALEITKPFNLMGWSMGGLIVSNYAKQYPNQVERLIVMDPAGYPIEMPSSAALIVKPLVGDYLFKLLGDNVMIDGCDSNFHHPEKFDAFKEEFKKQLEFKGYKRAILSTMRHTPMANNNATFVTVGEHPRPTLVIWGEEDSVTPYANSTLLMKAMPKATLLSVPDAGHGPHWENPELVNTTLIEFLRPKTLDDE